MARLLDRITQPTPQHAARALGFEQFLTTYTATGGNESLKASFQSYATEGYAGNGVVFSVILARLSLFSEAEFKFRDRGTKRLFGTPDLTLLETPWPNGTTGDLLARMEQDASLAGNAFIRLAAPDMLERLRPDLVDIITAVHHSGATEVIGYAYWRDGRGMADPDVYDVDDVAHWSPIPDPLAQFRGMSWLTSVVREVDSDTAQTQHKQAFFDNAATPNMLVRYPVKIGQDTADSIAERIRARHGGAANAWKTLVVDQGADVTMIGSSFEQMAFTDVQAAGENRIAAAAGVPGIVVGLKEGLDAASYSNYAQAMRRFADITMRPNWRSACGALSKLVTVPAGARLWYDTTDIAALREGENERAQTAQVNAAAMSTLIAAGYEPESVTRAVISGDLSLLTHTKLVSVQLQAPGSQAAPPALPPA